MLYNQPKGASRGTKACGYGSEEKESNTRCDTLYSSYLAILGKTEQAGIGIGQSSMIHCRHLLPSASRYIDKLDMCCR